MLRQLHGGGLLRTEDGYEQRKRYGYHDILHHKEECFLYCTQIGEYAYRLYQLLAVYPHGPISGGVNAYYLI